MWEGVIAAGSSQLSTTAKTVRSRLLLQPALRTCTVWHFENGQEPGQDTSLLLVPHLTEHGVRQGERGWWPWTGTYPPGVRSNGYLISLLFLPQNASMICTFPQDARTTYHNVSYRDPCCGPTEPCCRVWGTCIGCVVTREKKREPVHGRTRVLSS